eukprot:3592923-Rhodomonas_salina.2
MMQGALFCFHTSVENGDVCATLQKLQHRESSHELCPPCPAASIHSHQDTSSPQRDGINTRFKHQERLKVPITRYRRPDASHASMSDALTCAYHFDIEEGRG